MNALPSYDQLPISEALKRELRSDHAGEVGAVEIHRGILAVSRNEDVRRFAREHLETELRHRRFFDTWLPTAVQSRLLWLWRVAGWLLGALSALLGSRTVFRTIEAVESFVERHYRRQLDEMAGNPDLEPLRMHLEGFCEDEVEHRRDAAGRLPDARPAGAALWARIVGWGSAAGVALARRY